MNSSCSSAVGLEITVSIVAAAVFVTAHPGLGANNTGEQTIRLSDHDRVMASVETVPVEKRKLVHDLRAVGKVQYNETALATITSRVDGYVERLFVDYTGVQVKTGDHLVELYSPDPVARTG